MVLRGFPLDGAFLWCPPDLWDAEHWAIEIGDHPCVWTDGSADSYARADVAVVVAGVCLPAPEEEYEDARLDRSE